MSQHKFGVLDAMRGVAALAVLVFHFRRELSNTLGPTYGFASGYLAVDLFFVLSGFVVAFAYDRKLATGMTFRNFMKRRMIRLLPMIWVGVAIGTLLLLATSPRPVWQIATAAALNSVILPVPVGFRGAFFPPNGAEWSLFYEIVANLLFAAAATVLRGRALLALIGISAVGLAACAAVYGRLQHGYTLETLPVGFSRIGFSFFVGVALCRTRPLWADRIPRLSPMLILAATAIALYAPAPAILRPAYDLAFIVVASPMLVMAASVVEFGPRLRGMAAMLATMSYPLYAIHQPVRDIVRKLPVEGVMHSLLALTVMLLTIPVSLLLARYYDEPLRAWLIQVRWMRLAPALRGRAAKAP